MKLGIIGRGRWGGVYAKTLKAMGVDYWQAGRDWNKQPPADGYIIASHPQSHFRVAMAINKPMLIEKPVTMSQWQARWLLESNSENIVFVGHTHLYSKDWWEFKKLVLSVKRPIAIVSAAGGPCTMPVLWDWGPHDVAMCIDLMGKQPKEQMWDGETLHLEWDGEARAAIKLSDRKTERFMLANSYAYTLKPHTPTPMEILLREFIVAIDKGEPDVRGLELGRQVVNVLERAENRLTMKHNL